MTWQVTIRDDAASDLIDARGWYEQQRAGLGEEFLAALAEGFTRLESNPFQFPVYYRDFRRVLIRRFPFKVFFHIRGEAVIVFRILHSARDHTRDLK